MNFLIVHGAAGSPEGNWFPWLKKQLAPAAVRIPRFPTPNGQTLEAWLDVAATALGEWDPAETILIGHSSGAALVLRLAERVTRPFKAVLPICPFACDLGFPDYDLLNSSFVQPAFDWAAVKRGAQSITCFAGDNDPYVPLPYSQAVATACGAELIVIPGGGHLNAESGMVEFRRLFAWLQTFC